MKKNKMMETNVLTLKYLRLMRAKLFCFVSILLFCENFFCKEVSGFRIILLGDAVVYSQQSSALHKAKKIYNRKSKKVSKRSISSRVKSEYVKNIHLTAALKTFYFSTKLYHFYPSDISEKSICIAYGNTLFTSFFSKICVFHFFLYLSTNWSGFFFIRRKKNRRDLFSRPPPSRFL